MSRIRVRSLRAHEYGQTIPIGLGRDFLRRRAVDSGVRSVDRSSELGADRFRRIREPLSDRR